LVGGEYLIDDEYVNEILNRIREHRFIGNYCINVPVTKRKGTVPVLSDEITEIEPITGNLKSEHGGIKIENAPYEIKDYDSYVPVNNSTWNFNSSGIKDLITTYFVEAMAKTLNKVAYEKLKAAKSEDYSAFELVPTTVKLCSGSGKGIVFGNAYDKYIAIPNININEQPRILGTEVEIYDGIPGIIVGELKRSCLYVHGGKMKIGVDSVVAFNKNQTLITIEHSADFVPMDTKAFTVTEPSGL